MLHRPRNSERECASWTNSLVGQYLHQLSLVQSSRSIPHRQTAPWPKRYLFSFSLILGRTSLCFTDQETQEENVLSGPTHLWVGTYTSYLLYKLQDPFSACRQPHGQNNLFLCLILGRTSLCFTDQNTREENVHGGLTHLWVGTYTSYLLYKVQDPFNACRQPHDQNILFFVFDFRQDKSLLHRPRNSGRECAQWTNSLVGQ